MLLQRLYRLGVCGNKIAWFTSYLSDRKQRVKCGSQFSEWSLVNGGIPQGSALGPLLFLIYVNDMPSQVSHHRRRNKGGTCPPKICAQGHTMSRSCDKFMWH